jgi:ABC-type multidrug transport system fused ATPase/permease subunit
MNNQSANLYTLVKKLWKHLSFKRKRQFFLLFIIMILSAFSEVLSLGSVLPFLGALIAPDKVRSYVLVQYLFKIFNISPEINLILLMSITFSTLTILSGGIRIFQLWASTRFAYSTGADLSNELYRKTLYQPYQVHISRNSSEIISGITNKVNNVAFAILLAALTMLSSIILLISIAITMFAINPKVAFISSFVFGLSYVSITFLTRNKLKKNSQIIAEEQTQVVKALQEGLGGIRDVLLDSTQETYCEIYKKADHPLRVATGNNIFISQSPRYLMEPVGILLIVSLSYYLSLEPGGVAAALPVLGALALGAQKLLPALQLIYGSWASAVGCFASLQDTVTLLEQPLPHNAFTEKPTPLDFKSEIRFEDISFQYNQNSPQVLKSVNFTIQKGLRIGIIGTSGSGKSTALDILMGLLHPSSGNLIVDNQIITKELLPSWQQTIAHVPQNIYLADTTLAENIAFGVPVDLIDMERVKLAAKQAHISEFIEKRSNGYQSYLGERGVQLSGGQRQRIGIARALYKNASVLVFDEATSALDNSTEQSIMSTIESLDSHLTIVIVAHRLTTLKLCEFIIKLEEGKVTDIGSYEKMVTDQH